MKAAKKIIIAGVVGTTFMTLYSYWKSRQEKQEYVEPVMINKLIDRSGNLPDVNDNDRNPAGWGLHYLAGIAFVAAYWRIWRKALNRPTVPKIMGVGTLSGIAGIAVWKLLFAQHDNPPYNYRYGYYRQLLIAHVIFSAFALLSYKSIQLVEQKTPAMPEGPSLIIARDKMDEFIGHKVISAAGNAKIDMLRLENEKLMDIKTWGKHLLLCFDGFTVRIHFLLFGTYRINETKDSLLRLGLTFKNGAINIYTAAVKILEGDLNSHYDWTVDVMQENWDEKAAIEKLNEKPNMQICDALLEQDIFSGVGNIIKNEVLYRVHVHPESPVRNIPRDKLIEITQQARQYSFDFLKWKIEGTLKKHWLAHTKKICKRCDLPIHKEYTGTKKRRSFFCTNCQEFYK